MPETSPADPPFIASVLDQTALLAAWAEGADPGLPVPTCPGWTLTELVSHVGSTQRWVTRLVAEQVSDPMAAFALGWETAPTDPADWTDWLGAGAEGVRAAFGGTSHGSAVFDPSGGADGVSFWARRLFGEVSVHRIDAARTLGRPYALEPALAAAAIDDWLTTMASSGWAANVPGFTDAMRGDGERIAWVADDVDAAWLLRRGDAPLTLAHERGDADVTVHGPAVELLEIVSRRRALDDAESAQVEGDRSELAHLIANMTWVGAA